MVGEEISPRSTRDVLECTEDIEANSKGAIVDSTM